MVTQAAQGLTKTRQESAQSVNIRQRFQRLEASMGGPGSGSWYRYGTRPTAESCLRFTPRSLQKAIRNVQMGRFERDVVPLSWSQGDRPAGNILVFVEKRGAVLVARLVYSVTPPGGEKVARDYPVILTSTPSNLPGNSGRRWWFICPLVVNGRPCRRRVGVLYSVGGWFGCRHCHNLTYTSCNESHQMERLGGYLDAQIAADLGGRFTPDEVAETLRDFDRETRQLMYAANRLTRNSKKTERVLRRMGLR
jgi:hypothetical protein